MAYLGLIKRKERWGLTACGWVVMILAVIAGAGIAVVTIHPFLAVTQPVRCDILAVEGWLPDYALEKAIDEFNSNGYRLLVTTGLPLSRGFYLSEYKTCPEMAAATLKRLGFDRRLIAVVPALHVRKDGTYASAVSLREWLLDPGLSVKSLDICSLGPHTRRTRLLFKKALGGDIDVGIISFESQDYEPRVWWKTSKGVRAVIDETIAYLYARFFFYPTAP